MMMTVVMITFVDNDNDYKSGPFCVWTMLMLIFHI